MWRCPACGGPLAWRTPRRFERAQIDEEASGLWRYAASLPLGRHESATFFEQATPLTRIEVDGALPFVKLDFTLPSGSYKDRGAAVLVSALRMLGATHAVEDSSGNAAAAIAAYAARAAMACTVFAPASASPSKLVQSRLYGATVVPVAGSRDDVARAAMEAAAMPGATYASHNWHPFFIEGVKTWAFEVWEQLGFVAPEAVVVPVGSGSMLLGAALAFGSLHATGEIERMPRLFAAQPAACAPIVAALEQGADDTMPFSRTPTLAEGASIADPIRGRELLRAIRESDGGAVAVTEPEIVDALGLVGRHGIAIEPTSAVAVAGLRKLHGDGRILHPETTVVVLSGHGLKATAAIGELLEAPAPMTTPLGKNP